MGWGGTSPGLKNRIQGANGQKTRSMALFSLEVVLCLGWVSPLKGSATWNLKSACLAEFKFFKVKVNEKESSSLLVPQLGGDLKSTS